MQKIFYNGTIHTFQDDVQAEAMLVNDGSIVFVGDKNEVLSFKTDETELVDICGKHIYPSFFDTNISLYKIIEERIKTQNRSILIENNDEIDQNYDKFDNFEIYKKVFLDIQDECLKNGFTTVLEMGLSCKEFIFWKKLSEEKELKIDIIGYVDMINFKFVMDENCRSYRKYKNHFRLGGYSLFVDGTILNGKAWLSKPYRRERGYMGYGNLTFEQLSILIKSALDEKKQIAFFASGDNAVKQVLECFEERAKDKEKQDFFRPFISCSGMISKKQYLKIKDFDFSLGFMISDKLQSRKFIKKFIGGREKYLHNFKTCEKFGINHILQGSELEIKNLSKFFEYISSSKNAKLSQIGMKNCENLLKNLTISSSMLCFDEAYKGTLENGKLANFIVTNDDFAESAEILETYIEGELATKS